ncbi:hypothetical protein [Actinomadura macrotermitis]|uniref:Uncharacterized protein n=1 Tax=Actinomadura macrotermitis TaxID=2585200 RepID=A0A7K0BWX9_9ACTN|nr:hypothetical protein [Actinomadura macrotermitis]MQY05677.1 hypothetical protein [Actinomadura macrotermitis]
MSPQPPAPLSRACRAVVFATVCVVLATLGHALVSPDAVPPWAVLTGFGGTLAVAAALSGHERSLATILGGLLGGQFALHSLYTSASAPPGLLEHHPAAMPAAHHSSSTAMTLAHVAAAVLSAWWLRRGERAAWALARRLAARPLRLLLSVEPPAPAPRIPSVPVASSPRPRWRALRHQVVRRGPPIRSRALA